VDTEDQGASGGGTSGATSGVSRKLKYDVTSADGKALLSTGAETGGNETDEEKLKDNSGAVTRY